MSENKTASILQRLPIILAVTAASYGLPAQAARAHSTGASAAGTSAAATAPVTRTTQTTQLVRAATTLPR